MTPSSILHTHQAHRILNAIERWCAEGPDGAARVAVMGRDERGGWFARLDESTSSRGATLADALAQVATYAALTSDPPPAPGTDGEP